MNKLFKNPVIWAVLEFVLAFAGVYVVRMVLNKPINMFDNVVLPLIAAAAGYSARIRKYRKDDQ